MVKLTREFGEEECRLGERRTLCPSKCIDVAVIENDLKLSKEFMEKALKLAADNLATKLESMNQFQKRMDKLENTFATHKDIDDLKVFHNLDLKEVKTIIKGFERLVWTGTGIIVAVQLCVWWYFHK